MSLPNPRQVNKDAMGDRMVCDVELQSTIREGQLVTSKMMTGLI